MSPYRVNHTETIAKIPKKWELTLTNVSVRASDMIKILPAVYQAEMYINC